MNNPYANLGVTDAEYANLVAAPHTKPAASSGTGNGSCVTWALSEDGRFISFQDDKLSGSDRAARTQLYTRQEIAALVSDAKAGLLDHLC